MTTELIACSLSNIKMQKTGRGKPSMQKYEPASDLGVRPTRDVAGMIQAAFHKEGFLRKAVPGHRPQTCIGWVSAE